MPRLNHMPSLLRSFLPLLAMAALIFVAQWVVSNAVRESPTTRVIDYKLSSDGRYTVYRAMRETDGAIELYSAPAGGGAPVRLNRVLAIEHSVSEYQISPDSNWVVYIAPQDNPDFKELYSVPIGGPPDKIVKLNDTLVFHGQVLGFQISPDSNQVTYIVSQAIRSVNELYSVAIEGPATTSTKIGESAGLGDLVFEENRPDDQSIYRINQDEN